MNDISGDHEHCLLTSLETTSHNLLELIYIIYICLYMFAVLGYANALMLTQHLFNTDLSSLCSSGCFLRRNYSF